MRTIAALLALLMLQACNAEADSVKDVYPSPIPMDWRGIYATPVDDYGVRCYRLDSKLSCVQVRPSLPKPPMMEGQQNGG